MSIDFEHTFALHELRDRPSFVPPLPRLTPKFEPYGKEDTRYEVVVVGVRRAK